jgi:hypothetical protein
MAEPVFMKLGMYIMAALVLQPRICRVQIYGDFHYNWGPSQVLLFMSDQSAQRRSADNAAGQCVQKPRYRSLNSRNALLQLRSSSIVVGFPYGEEVHGFFLHIYYYFKGECSLCSVIIDSLCVNTFNRTIRVR